MERIINKYILGFILILSSYASYAGIYMQVDGITGSVTAKGHEGWIDISGASMSSSNINDKVVMAPVVVTKQLDLTSPLLNLEVWTGMGKIVQIHLVNVGTDQINTYMEYTLEGARFISVETNSSGDRPIETYKIDFEKITGQFIPFDDTGKPGSPVPFGYDLTTGTKF